MSVTIGIDLGTTNSCVAFMEGGVATVIPNAEGARTTPSVVAFTSSGERLTGQAAKRQAVVNPARTIASVKRDMGSDKRFVIDGKSYSPQEISAFILQKLKSDAESYIGSPVTDAVITVPAYFTDAQRQGTKDAGKIAGLNVLRIVNEPTAAALAYGIDKQEPQKILVYDLGGGTFDVSVLDINSDVIEVLATAGNNRLGGDDFDECVARYLVDEFKRTEKIDLRKDNAAMQRVREAAEKAKIELSGLLTTQVSLPFLTTDKQGPKHMEITLTRAKFNELTAHLVEKTLSPMKQAMSDAGLKPADLRRVLLVGGSTRIPAVQDAVKAYTGMEPSRNINPDECVAVGACLQSGVLTGQVKGLLLMDVTPLSLGIETMGDVFAPIINRNTPIPVKQSQIFTTAASFQTSVEVHVLQGERSVASANRALGKFRLTGIRRAMRGVPQIEVTFAIDANGIVNVSAKDLDTQKSQQITLVNSTNMSKGEIERAVEDARRYAQEDAAKKDSAMIRDRAAGLVAQAKAALKQLSGPDAEQVTHAMREVNAALKGKDNMAIQTATDALAAALSSAGRPPEDGAMPDDGAYEAQVDPTEKP